MSTATNPEEQSSHAEHICNVIGSATPFLKSQVNAFRELEHRTEHARHGMLPTPSTPSPCHAGTYIARWVSHLPSRGPSIATILQCHNHDRPHQDQLLGTARTTEVITESAKFNQHGHLRCVRESTRRNNHLVTQGRSPEGPTTCKAIRHPDTWFSRQSSITPGLATLPMASQVHPLVTKPIALENIAGPTLS